MLRSDRWLLNFVIVSGEKVTNYSLLVVFAFLVVYETKSKGCLPKKVLSNLPSSVSRRVVMRACLVSAAHEPNDASQLPALIIEPRLSSPGLGQVSLRTRTGTRISFLGCKEKGSSGTSPVRASERTHMDVRSH